MAGKLSVASESRLFQSFRALGVVASDVPIVLTRTGFITVAIGKSFQVYDTEKLTPVAVSSLLPKKIRAIEATTKNHLTFCAVGRNIHVFMRVTESTILTGHSAAIRQLLCVGNLLFSMSRDDRTLCIWNIESFTLVQTHTFDATFTPSFIVHPSTYLNKVLIGSIEGPLQLLNIRTLKCIYTFPGWSSEVTCMTQSPAVDVVAIGTADGCIRLHHLKVDQTLMMFSQAKDGRVTALSFRTDDKAPWLASGATTGDVYVWNLETQRLEQTITRAHEAAIASAIFLPSEPVLVTSANDNALQCWLFEGTASSSSSFSSLESSNARLLKTRRGHQQPPTRIRYYGNAQFMHRQDGTACQILSAGQDRSFRLFHTARTQQSTELSQGHIAKKAKKLHVSETSLKLPPIVGFDAHEAREKDWANIVTCHEHVIPAYVWTLDRRTMEAKKVLQQVDGVVEPGSAEDFRRQSSKATAVAVSPCGHFAVVGALGGAIFKYNLQSGERRGSFPTSATPKPALIRSLTMPGVSYKQQSSSSSSSSSNHRNNNNNNADDADDDEHSNMDMHQHRGPVTGVAVDATNQVLVSSSLDGTLKFWDFHSHAHLATIDASTPLSHLCLHREANLVVVAGEDLILRVYDIATRKLVRRFTGHTHQLTDVSMTQDARWILTSSRDGSVRVWDVPTGKCVDWIRFEHAVTSVCASPKAEFFATTHVGQRGIYLWANRAFVEHVFLDTVPEKPVQLGMPIPLSEVDAPLEHLVTTIGGAAEVKPLEKKVHALHRRDDDNDDDKYDYDGRSKTRHDSSSSSSSSSVSSSLSSEGKLVFPSSSPLDNDNGDHYRRGHRSLITLSCAPKAMWQSLFKLELIKARNKPKEAPKAPEKAPFFLPTVRKEDVHPTFERVGQDRDRPNPGSSTIGLVPPVKESGTGGSEDPAMMSVWVDDDHAWNDDDDKEEEEYGVENDDVDGSARDKDEDLHTNKRSRSTTTTTATRSSVPSLSSSSSSPSSSSSLSMSRIVKSTGLKNMRSKLATLLEQCAARPEVLGGNAAAANAHHHHYRFDAVLAYLQSLSPSSVDVELSTLCMGDFDEEGKVALGLFLTCLLEAVQSRQEFQVVQVYLNRFLKVHEEVLAHDKMLLERVVELHSVQQQAWEHLQSLLLNSLCLVQHFSNIQM